MGDDLGILPLCTVKYPAHRENVPGLVVDQHHADQTGALGYRLYKGVGIKHTVGIRGDTDYLEPCLLQLPEGFPHRGMLHSGGDDPGLVLPICPGNSTDGKIVAFRCSGGEVDAARFTGKDGS